MTADIRCCCLRRLLFLVNAWKLRFILLRFFSREKSVICAAAASYSLELRVEKYSLKPPLALFSSWLSLYISSTRNLRAAFRSRDLGEREGILCGLTTLGQAIVIIITNPLACCCLRYPFRYFVRLIRHLFEIKLNFLLFFFTYKLVFHFLLIVEFVCMVIILIQTKNDQFK